MSIVSKDAKKNRMSFNYPSKQLLISTTRQFINARSYPESGTLLDAHPPVILQPRVGHSPLLFLLQQHVDHIAAYSNCSRKEEEVQNGFFGYLQHHLSPVVLLELFLVFLHSGFSYGDDRRVSEFLNWPQLHEVSWVFRLNGPRHRQIHYKFASNAFEILGVCCEQRQKFNCMRLYPSLRRGISIKFVFAPESGHISAVILERAFNCNIESLHDVLIRCFEQLYEVRIDARWKMLILDWHQVIEKLPLLYLLLLLLFLLHLRILVPQNAVNIGQGKLVRFPQDIKCAREVEAWFVINFEWVKRAKQAPLEYFDHYQQNLYLILIKRPSTNRKYSSSVAQAHIIFFIYSKSAPSHHQKLM